MKETMVQTLTLKFPGIMADGIMIVRSRDEQELCKFIAQITNNRMFARSDDGKVLTIHPEETQ